MEKLMSRKFWVMVLTNLALLGVGMSDATIGVYAIVASVVVTVAWLVAQAYVDAVGAANTQVDEVLARIEQLVTKLVGE